MAPRTALGALLKFAIAAALVLVGISSAPAWAAPGPVVSPIQSGNNGTITGTATFTRINQDGGTETLNVRIVAPQGMSQTHLCLSDTAFTSRVSPGSCPYKHEGLTAATSDEYNVSLGTEYVAEKLYAQLHVTTAGGQTAYAGWVSAQGGAFYGNVEIEPSPVPGVPAAPLMGAAAPLAAGVVFAAGAGIAVWLRSRRAAVEPRSH